MVKKRKPLSWLIIAMLLIGLLPSAVLGASPANAADGNGNGQSKISLEKAIQTVKDNFTIPSNLNDFSSSFQNSNDEKVWHLNWRSKNEDQGNFTATVDASSGEVTNMNYWRPRNESDTRVPSITVAKAQQMGQDLLNRLVPGKAADLKMEKDNNLVMLGSYAPLTYTINWQRMSKNIPVENDRGSMEIDMQKGQITSYYLNWTDTSLPDPAKVITTEQARQVFAQQQMLKLQYVFPGRFQPYRSEQGFDPQPQLVYGIKHISNGMIDAFTGTPLSNADIGYFDKDGGMGLNTEKMLMKSNNPAPTAALTPEEQREIETSKKFISQEQAVQIVKKWINIPAGLELQSAILEKNGRDPRLRSWDLNWQKKSGPEAVSPKITSPYFSLWAQVDAGSGELISFYLGQGVEDKQPAAMTKEAAQAMADKFVKEIQAPRWEQLQLNSDLPQTSPREDNPTSWTFNYQRLVNGIICPDDGITISVDAINKQISSFSLNWTKATFPAANGIIDINKANQQYLQVAPLQLSYFFTEKNPGDRKARLIYKPQNDQGVSLIDAKSGASLDSDGKSVSSKIKATIFNDIKGNFAEKEIVLLGQAGIFTEYGSSFHPNENVTLRSLLKAMLTSREGTYSVQDIDDKELFKRCQNLGWIKSDTSLSSTVNRELLAQLMVRYLNIEFLTRAQDIFKLPYKDAANLSANTKACAALTWSLGIIRADGKNFNPGHTVSRAEAASVLVHTLSIETQP